MLRYIIGIELCTEHCHLLVCFRMVSCSPDLSGIQIVTVPGHEASVPEPNSSCTIRTVPDVQGLSGIRQRCSRAWQL